MASDKGQRGVTRPGYQVGSRKTSPVPGMSRTQAAINSLTAKGRAENADRIHAEMSAHFKGYEDAIKAGATPTRTSGLKGRAVGAMDHMGGHGLQAEGSSRPGGFDEPLGGGGINAFNK